VFPDGDDIDDLIQPVWHLHKINALEVEVGLGKLIAILFLI
jgi:hypothetical protein